MTAAINMAVCVGGNSHGKVVPCDGRPSYEFREGNFTGRYIHCRFACEQAVVSLYALDSIDPSSIKVSSDGGLVTVRYGESEPLVYAQSTP